MALWIHTLKKSASMRVAMCGVAQTKLLHAPRSSSIRTVFRLRHAAGPSYTFHSIAIAKTFPVPFINHVCLSALRTILRICGCSFLGEHSTASPTLLDVFVHVRDVFQMIFSSAWGNLGRATSPY